MARLVQYGPRWGDAMVVRERTLRFGGFNRLTMYRVSRPLLVVVS